MNKVRRTSVECSDKNFNETTFNTQVETIIASYKSVTTRINSFLDWLYEWESDNLDINDAPIEIVSKEEQVNGVTKKIDVYQKRQKHNAYLYVYPLAPIVVEKLRELDESIHKISRENLELKAYTTGIAKNMIRTKNYVQPEMINSILHKSSAEIGNTHIGEMIQTINTKILDRMYKMVNLNHITKTMAEEALVEEIYSDIENELLNIIQGIEHNRLDLELGTSVTQKSNTFTNKPGFC